MRGHVDAEALALCAEGLLGRRRSGRIRSHVARCPECAATQARLTEVPALLARVPPPPVPPGIAARLDAALSAETARRAQDPATAQQPGTAPDDTVPAQGPPTVPGAGTHRQGGRRGPRPRIPVPARILATAGVLVAAGGVGYAVAQSSPPATSASSGSEAATSGSSGNPAVRSPAGGGATVQFTVRSSGTRYGTHTFAAQAAALVHKPSAGLFRPGAAIGSPSRPAAGSVLAKCVENVAGPSAVQAHKVELVDRAHYGGQPATIIAVAASSGRPDMVYVAGPRCSASERDILAQAALP
jgi:hypothetical protein